LRICGIISSRQLLLSLSLSVLVNGFWPPSEEGGLLAVPTECDSC
jgi:hypothetical protein